MSDGLETLGFKLRIEFLTPVLGSQPQRDIATEYVAKKNGIDLPEDEAATLPEAIERGMTAFHRDEDENPLLFDYQVRGFLKAAANVYNGRIKPKGMQKPVRALKSKVERTVFVFPRKLRLNLPQGEGMDQCDRPLRAETARGPRVSIAMSEMLPQGTWFECQVEVLPGDIDETVLTTLLDYGYYQGLGQWRSGGYGRFTYTMEREG